MIFGLPLITLVAKTSGLQCWPVSRAHRELACFEIISKIEIIDIRCEFYKQGSGKEKERPPHSPIDRALQYLPLLVRSASDKKPGCSHHLDSFLWPGFSRES